MDSQGFKRPTQCQYNPLQLKNRITGNTQGDFINLRSVNRNLIDDLKLKYSSQFQPKAFEKVRF